MVNYISIELSGTIESGCSDYWILKDEDGNNHELEQFPILCDCVGNTRSLDFLKEPIHAPYIISTYWNFTEYKYCPIKINDKWGFVDNHLDIVVEPVFDFVGEEYNHQRACHCPPDVDHITEWIDGFCPVIYEGKEYFIDLNFNLYSLDKERIGNIPCLKKDCKTYEDRIRQLSQVTLDGISNVCRSLLPQEFRNCPWLLPYGDKDFTKIFTSEDQLNGYAAAYTTWHKGKLRHTFEQTPGDTFVGDFAVIDWGCGQGLATLFLREYIQEKGFNGHIKEVILIEPSEKALERAKFNIKTAEPSIRISTVNKKLDDLLDIDVELFVKRKVIHLFSNILDVRGISLKKITERLSVNISRDNYILCVSPYYPHMTRTFDSFLQYFQRPLIWQYREEHSNKTDLGYTYYIQSLKLMAERSEQIIKYEYFPASQFRACYVLDCVRGIADEALSVHSYFDVYAPYELGASISDDIEPILAVLNNVICRGLPSKSSPFVESLLSGKLHCSEIEKLYGGIYFKSQLDHAQEQIVEDCIKEKRLSTDILVNQLVYIPIAVARVEKLLVEALITGRLDLQKEEWNVLIEEGDVPFGEIAIEDFRQMFNHLTALSQDFDRWELPKINLTVISNKYYANSDLLDNDALFEATDEVRDRIFDLVVKYSSVPKENDCNFTEYQVHNDCFFCVFPAAEQYAQRYIYTTDRIYYKDLCVKQSQGTFRELEGNVSHLRYFLQLLFRKEDFRPGQLPILSRAVQNKSVIGLLPTGGGKSLTYQLAAFLQPGISLVIDPLVSLMKGQYDDLINAGIDCCTYINAQVGETRVQRELDMEHSKCLFVFLSPERLCIHNFRQRLRNMQELNVYFAYGVIDETHCVSEWGHDFRFSYLHLGRNLYQYVLPKQSAEDEHISLFGLTATASFDVLADVERELSGEGAFPIDNDAVVRYENTNRLELQYYVVPIDGSGCNSKWDVYERKNDLVANVLHESMNYLNELQEPKNLEYIKQRFLQRENIQDEKVVEEIMNRDISVNVDSEWMRQENGNASAIVFCPHRQGSLGVNDTMTHRGVASAIAGGLDTPLVGNYVGGDLLDEQDKFLKGESCIMVATKAFGMGIDKPNVRFTININHSGSLEGYVQEAGRAGRDRKMALSTIMYCAQEFSEQDELTRVISSIPVDYGVHLSFYKRNFKGVDYEKFIMTELLSNTNMSVLQDEKENTMNAFLESLLSLKDGDSFSAFISYKCERSYVEYLQNRIDKLNAKGYCIRNILTPIAPADSFDYNKSIKQREEDMLQYLGYTKNGKKEKGGYQTDIEKAIYRMCCIGLIDDFTQDYNNERFRVLAVKRSDKDYLMRIKSFLLRYYSEERATKEIQGIDVLKGNNMIHKCLSFLTKFVYTMVAMKRERAMKDMEAFCYQATHSKTKNWLETNEDLKDYIYYYFNSKYARDDYQIDGNDYSLKMDTDRNREDFDVVRKYIEAISIDPSGSEVDNVKHLYGATLLVLRAHPDNAALNLLRTFCIIFLGIGSNQNLRNDAFKGYIDGFVLTAKSSSLSIKSLSKLMEEFNGILLRYTHKDNITEMKLMEWSELVRLNLHNNWLGSFTDKYDN